MEKKLIILAFFDVCRKNDFLLLLSSFWQFFVRPHKAQIYCLVNDLDLLQVTGLCAASKRDDYMKLLTVAVCCEIAVQCNEAGNCTSILMPLLDLLLAPDCFHEKQVF